jgi:hypothetical protein
MNDQTPDVTRFRRTLVRVMTMQVGTLILLWLLQRVFTH